MRVLNEYTEEERKFYESIGLLAAREITAEKAAEMSGYSFSAYVELLEKINIHPYVYDSQDFEKDLESINTITSK